MPIYYSVQYGDDMISANLENVAGYFVQKGATAHSGTIYAYNPGNFVNIYGYTNTGTEKINAYAMNSGLQPNMTTTISNAYPAYLPYKRNNYYAIGDAFANLALNNYDIGYPMCMIQAYTYQQSAAIITLSLYGFAICGRTAISFASSSNVMIFSIYKRNRQGSGEHNGYWNGSSWQSSTYSFQKALSNTTYGIGVHFDIAESSLSQYSYRIEAHTIINNKTSITTHVEFQLSKDKNGFIVAQITDYANQTVTGILQNMYYGKYFSIALQSGSSTNKANLPMFGAPDNIPS